MPVKRCPACGETKDLEQFYRHASTKDGRQTYCIPCFNARQRAVYERNRAAINARTAANARRRALARVGATEGERCEACGCLPTDARNGNHASATTTAKAKRLAMDHDHGTGAFRGWLCSSCNTALGYMDDDPALLRRLADYIERVRDAIA